MNSAIMRQKLPRHFNLQTSFVFSLFGAATILPNPEILGTRLPPPYLQSHMLLKGGNGEWGMGNGEWGMGMVDYILVDCELRANCEKQGLKFSRPFQLELTGETKSGGCFLACTVYVPSCTVVLFVDIW